MTWRRHALLLVAITLTVGAHDHTRAMNIAPAPLEVLIEEAHLVVRGLVLTAEAEEVPERPGQFRTRHQLVVWEHLKAPRSVHDTRPPGHFEILEVLQPGGRVGSLTTMVPGVVTLRPGDEVILLLVTTPWGLQPLGYSLGTFFVEAKGDVLPAWSGHRPPGTSPTLPLRVLEGREP